MLWLRLETSRRATPTPLGGTQPVELGHADHRTTARVRALGPGGEQRHHRPVEPDHLSLYLRHLDRDLIKEPPGPWITGPRRPTHETVAVALEHFTDMGIPTEPVQIGNMLTDPGRRPGEGVEPALQEDHVVLCAHGTHPSPSECVGTTFLGLSGWSSRLHFGQRM